MDKDTRQMQPDNNNNLPAEKQKQQKNEKLAVALRANLRRRKLVSSLLSNDDRDSGE